MPETPQQESSNWYVTERDVACTAATYVVLCPADATRVCIRYTNFSANPVVCGLRSNVAGGSGFTAAQNSVNEIFYAQHGGLTQQQWFARSQLGCTMTIQEVFYRPSGSMADGEGGSLDVGEFSGSQELY